MPKKTFFRLPEEKQKRLLDAAQEEFSRVPLQEASVANIVRLADIPRGSFYQYFENKEDLYYYYFDILRTDSKKSFENYLKEKQGNVFNAFQMYFNRMIEEILLGPDAAFYKNLFMYMDYHGTAKFSPELTNVEQRLKKRAEIRKSHMKRTDSILDLIDTSILKTEDAEELIGLLKLLFSMFFSSINHAYKVENRGLDIDIEQIKKEFSIKLKWLKYGVYKDGEGEVE